MKIDTMTRAELASYFGYSLLGPNCRQAEFDQFLANARQYGVYSVAINGAWVPYAVEHLRDTGIKVGSTAGFPFGQMAVTAKREEARIALSQGAEEIDYVLHIGRLLDHDYHYIADEMREMVLLCHSQGAVAKVILENCYLGREEIRGACEIAVEQGIDFVKTSTGFGPGGAEADDVRLMKQVVGDRVLVKAAGAMRTLDKTAQMIELGASRIGSGFVPDILNEFSARYSR